MGYVGNQSTNAYSSLPAKQDLTGATGTSLTLSHAVAGPESIDLVINNVRQEPTTAYSVSDTTVTLTGSVVASDDIYVVYNGLALQTIAPPDGSVSTAKIADDAVTSAKIADNAVVTASIADDAITLSKAADDFYRTGTWTPTFTSGSGSFNGLTMSGTFTRIGRLCHVTANILITASGNAGADLTIGNLPFTNNTASMRIAGVWRENAVTGDMGQWVIVHNTKAGFLQTTSGGNPAATTGRNYVATVTYQTDDA